MGLIPHMFVLTFLLLSSSSFLQETVAVKYVITNTVPNTPGGARFNSELGDQWTTDLMGTINKFIWKLFQQNSQSQRKQVPVLNLNITVLNDGAMGETANNNILIDANAIMSFAPGTAKFEFSSLMYHEMTHIFQWSGQGTAPGGLTEGMADYVMVKSGFYDPNSYTKPGEGSKWDEGYGVTERFLEYCDSLRKGFTAELNNKMRDVYKDEYFMDLLGKPLDQVWSNYKAKYGNIGGTSNGDVRLKKGLKY